METRLLFQAEECVCARERGRAGERARGEELEMLVRCGQWGVTDAGWPCSLSGRDSAHSWGLRPPETVSRPGQERSQSHTVSSAKGPPASPRPGINIYRGVPQTVKHLAAKK